MKFLYRSIKGAEKKFFFALRWMRLLGVKEGLAFCWRNRKPGHVLQVLPPGVERPIALRSQTSDIPAFEDVFMFDHYAFELERPPAVIVDAGGHIGLVTVMFANRYRDARIIALEPEAGNYDLLKQNVDGYDNVEVLNLALWDSNRTLNIANPDDSTWCYRVEDAPGGDVEAVTIDELMQRCDLDTIDLLKIDIEGAEKEVLEAGGDWLAKVGCLAVELHDRMKPGCSRAFYNATNAFPHEMQVGENVIVSTDAWRARATS